MSAKVAIVTGANRGLGLAVVRILCERLVKGSTVYLTCRNLKDGEEAARSLPGHLAVIPTPHQLDVTDPPSVARLADTIRHKHGGFHFLVNNAAIMDYETLYPTYEGAKQNIDCNYRSLLTIEQHLYPLLHDYGRVVNISSSCGHLSNLRNPEWVSLLKNPDLSTEQLNDFVDGYLDSVRNGTFKKEDFADEGRHAEHRVSKIALTALTMIQARKYAPRHISINALYPGYLATDMARGAGPTPPEQAAQLVAYLLLDASPNLNGTFMWHDRKLVDWYDHEGDYYYKHRILE